jgi:hypothetical protein
MDTERDFLFLNERTAKEFNSFDEREYLLIQTYPPVRSLSVKHRSFDYESAKSYENIENLSHDYASFDLRIFHNLELWTVDFEGNPQSLSEQQDWKIAQEYFQPRKTDNTECEITDRDVAAAQVVLVRVLAAVGPGQISLTRKCIRNENAENQAPKFLCCQDDKSCAVLVLEAASMCFQCGE